MAEVSKHINNYKNNEHINNLKRQNNKQKTKAHTGHKKLSNNFVSKVVLWQTNPQKPNYTIYVKIVINPPQREPQEVRFPYKPDKESLESVIDEMIDALQLNPHLHYKPIVQSIQMTMKTKRMRIVQSSPINIANNNDQNEQQQNKKKKKKKSKKSKGHNNNNNNKRKSSSIAPSLKLSPKKHTNVSHSNSDCDDMDDFEYFSPLSPLVVSPRTIHRKSTAKFPALRSHSMSESDPLSLIKQVKYDDVYYNSNSASHSGSSTNSRRNSGLINDHYMDKYLQAVHDEEIIVNHHHHHHGHHPHHYGHGQQRHHQ